jgi:hypothetical protein
LYNLIIALEAEEAEALTTPIQPLIAECQG